MKGLKMLRFGLVVLLAASLVFAFTACGTGKGDGADKKAKILYFVDNVSGTDAIPGVLDQYNAKVTTETDFANLDDLIGSDDWDLIIMMNQGDYHDFTSLTNLPTYLAMGGKAIFADWQRDDPSLQIFGATSTGNTNNDTVHITNAELADGVMNPLMLFDPGWGVWAVGLAADTANGYWSAAEFGNGDDAVVFSADRKTAVVGWLNDTVVDEAAAAAFYDNLIRMVYQ